ARGADDRAEEDALVHDRGQARKDFAYLHAGNIGVDRLELPADFGRRVGLNLPHVLVRGTPAKEDVDDRFIRRTDAAPGLGPEQVRQAEGHRPDAERAHAQKAAPGQAVAKAMFTAENGEHDEDPPQVSGQAGLAFAARGPGPWELDAGAASDGDAGRIPPA